MHLGRYQLQLEVLARVGRIHEAPFSERQIVITNEQQTVLHARLVKGSGILGTLWRDGIRCISAWSGVCPCHVRNNFCISKIKWLGLLKELHDGWYPYDLVGHEGFLILECMDAVMFQASGLKLLKAAPGARALIRIHRNETNFQAVLDIAEMEVRDDEVPGAVVRIQEIIGSRLQDVEQESAASG